MKICVAYGRVEAIYAFLEENTDENAFPPVQNKCLCLKILKYNAFLTPNFQHRPILLSI